MVVQGIEEPNKRWWSGFVVNEVEEVRKKGMCPRKIIWRLLRVGYIVIVLYDYDAAEDNKLTIKEGDMIVGIGAVSDEWWSGKVEGPVPVPLYLLPIRISLYSQFLSTLSKPSELRDLDLSNIEATSYIELRTASPLPPPPSGPVPGDLPSWAYTFLGAYTLETHSHLRPIRSYIDVLASTTPTMQYY
ncbi:hypothetical protein F5877DRAFT_69804 [Lentinula edodes]|nr:hypothetical protein F5877DRAFT_69804 [Lentinula edodes]